MADDTITKRTRISFKVGVIATIIAAVGWYLHNQLQAKTERLNDSLVVHETVADKKFNTMTAAIQEQLIQNARTLTRMEAAESTFNYHRAEDVIKSEADVREAMRD